MSLVPFVARRFIPRFRLSLASAQEKVSGPLAGTKPLTMEGDIAAQMVAGIDKFLLREIELSVERRGEILEARFLARRRPTTNRSSPTASG